MKRTFFLALLLSGCAVHGSSRSSVSPTPAAIGTPDSGSASTAAPASAGHQPVRTSAPASKPVVEDTTPSATVTAAATATIDWAALRGPWHLDRKGSTATRQVYVPTTVDLGVSRFRPRMEFEPDGTLHVLTLGETDRHRMVEGTWTRTADSITMRYEHPERGEPVVRTIEVEGLAARELVITRSRPQSPSPG